MVRTGSTRPRNHVLRLYAKAIDALVRPADDDAYKLLTSLRSDGDTTKQLRAIQLAGRYFPLEKIFKTFLRGLDHVVAFVDEQFREHPELLKQIAHEGAIAERRTKFEEILFEMIPIKYVIANW